LYGDIKNNVRTRKRTRAKKNQKHVTDLKSISANVLLAALLVVVFVASLFLGNYPIDPITVIRILDAGILEFIGNAILSLTGIKLAFFWVPQTWSPVMDTVVWSIRFPRAVAVALVGAGLAISGAVFQSTFRNPLVSESILGVSEGAAVGAAIAILLSQSSVVIELSAFAFGVLAVAMTYQLSRTYRSNPTLVLVLAGIIVGSLFASVISLIKYVADPYTVLPSITYWLLGSFANVDANDVLMVAPVLLGCISILLLIRWRLNVLSMGDEEARTLGIDTHRLRLLVIACATLATAACVSISGLVGWVGLVIPQIARMVVGPNHKVMLPATVLIGASYLLVIDTICRDLTTGEIPISIVTGIVGAPIFMLLLKNATQSWA
jgi:iron complex transport system permease protein